MGFKGTACKAHQNHFPIQGLVNLIDQGIQKPGAIIDFNSQFLPFSNHSFSSLNPLMLKMSRYSSISYQLCSLSRNRPKYQSFFLFSKVLQVSSNLFFKISNHVIAQAIKTFKPLPHRLEYVGKYSGIIFYNDALATTPEATIEAIKALKNVGTIFLGGEDRGYRFINLVKIIKQYRIKNIVLFPKTGQKIYRQLKLQFNKLPRILKTTDMEEAVKFAYQCTLKNSVCLLSTASPSYSLWKNYEENGNLFKSFVKKYSI